MNYYFKRDGKEEKVDVEPWQWGIIRMDGTELHQFEPNGEKGVFHQFAEIDQATVKIFAMYKETEMATRRIDIVKTPDMQIFHFYRNIIFNGGTPSERRSKAYVFGWKKTDGSMSYNYILPDGRIITADRDIKGLPEFGL